MDETPLREPWSLFSIELNIGIHMCLFPITYDYDVFLNNDLEPNLSILLLSTSCKNIAIMCFHLYIVKCMETKEVKIHNQSIYRIKKKYPNETNPHW